MDVLIEVIGYLILAFAPCLVMWCAKHKNVTLAIFAGIIFVVDVIVLMKLL